MIIGITGTNGAGKGTVVDYLVAKGFAHYSVRSLLIEELERRHLPIDRPNMREVANEIRKTHAPSYIIEELFKKATAGGGDAVIESVRNVGEAEFLRAHGVQLWSVDADREMRYERIVTRGTATDHLDYETFVAQEEREWNNTDTYDMDVPGVMRMADVLIPNNGSREQLQVHVDEALDMTKRQSI